MTLAVSLVSKQGSDSGDERLTCLGDRQATLVAQVLDRLELTQGVDTGENLPAAGTAQRLELWSKLGPDLVGEQVTTQPRVLGDLW